MWTARVLQRDVLERVAFKAALRIQHEDAVETAQQEPRGQVFLAFRSRSVAAILFRLYGDGSTGFDGGQRDVVRLIGSGNLVGGWRQHEFRDNEQQEQQGKADGLAIGKAQSGRQIHEPAAYRDHRRDQGQRKDKAVEAHG